MLLSSQYIMNYGNNHSTTTLASMKTNTWRDEQWHAAKKRMELYLPDLLNFFYGVDIVSKRLKEFSFSRFSFFSYSVQHRCALVFTRTESRRPYPLLIRLSQAFKRKYKQKISNGLSFRTLNARLRKTFETVSNISF